MSGDDEAVDARKPAETRDAPGERRICLAAFAGAHGVRGEAKLKSFTEDPAAVADYAPLESENGARAFNFEILREAKPGVFIVRSPEIGSREDALALAGVKLYAPRSRLPDPEDAEEFYYEDLIGLAVVSPDGEPLGRVKAVVNFGAGDLLEIAGIPGVKGARLVPFTREAVPVIDMDAGRIVFAPASDWI